MWKYFGWPLALAAVIGAYVVYSQGATREAALRFQLQESEQLVVQVSNRLAVVEAQFNTYKLAQEREARERQLRERDNFSSNIPVRTNDAQTEKHSATTDPVAEPIDARRDDTKNRRTSTAGRSIGEGINSLLDRLRGSFSN